MPVSSIAAEKKVEILFKSEMNISRRGRGCKEDFLQDSSAVEYARSLLGNVDSCISSEWGSKLAKVFKCTVCGKYILISNLAFSSKFKNASKGIAGPGILYTTLNNESIFYRKHMASHEDSQDRLVEPAKRKREFDDLFQDSMKKRAMLNQNHLFRVGDFKMQNLNIQIPISLDPLRSRNRPQDNLIGNFKLNKPDGIHINLEKKFKNLSTNDKSESEKNHQKPDVSTRDSAKTPPTSTEEKIAQTLVLFSEMLSSQVASQNDGQNKTQNITQTIIQNNTQSNVQTAVPEKISTLKQNLGVLERTQRRAPRFDKLKLENLPIYPKEKIIFSPSSATNETVSYQKNNWKAWDSSLTKV